MPLSLRMPRWSHWPRTGRTAPPPELLAPTRRLEEARGLQAAGRLEEAEHSADTALELQEGLVGRNHAALVPYLLTLAGIRYARHGWAAARAPYERAQLLRGPRSSSSGRR